MKNDNFKIYYFRTSLPDKLPTIPEEKPGQDMDYDDDSFEADQSIYDQDRSSNSSDGTDEDVISLNSKETINSSFGESFNETDGESDFAAYSSMLSTKTFTQNPEEVNYIKKILSKKKLLISPTSCFKVYWDYAGAVFIVNIIFNIRCMLCLFFLTNLHL